MRRTISACFLALGLSLVFLIAPSAHAQIVGQLEANIHHSFTVGQSTLPPGKYIFRMTSHRQNTMMTITNANGKTSEEVVVRAADDSHTPHRDELIFDRYGKNEFLTHVYQRGEKVGVTVVEPSKEESQLQQQGKKPVEHTEEQSQ